MRHVLVAIGLDDHAGAALAVAHAVAGPDTRIRIVHVDAPLATAAPAGSGPPPSFEARLAMLRTLAEGIPGAEHKLLSGVAPRAILDEARGWRADTIVVAPRSRSKVERFLMGSLSSTILKDAPCNVLLARPLPGGLRRILVCTDMHEPSRRATLVADRIARSAGAQNTLLFAADPAYWGPDATAPWPPDAYDINADWLDRAQQEALRAWLRQKLDEFNASHSGGRATTRLVEGGPKDVILREAASHDLLVLGTHGPNSYERAVVGSVAEHVAARAPVSVLVVKKDATE